MVVCILGMGVLWVVARGVFAVSVRQECGGGCCGLLWLLMRIHIHLKALLDAFDFALLIVAGHDDDGGVCGAGILAKCFDFARSTTAVAQKRKAFVLVLNLKGDNKTANAPLRREWTRQISN